MAHIQIAFEKAWQTWVYNRHIPKKTGLWVYNRHIHIHVYVYMCPGSQMLPNHLNQSEPCVISIFGLINDPHLDCKILTWDFSMMSTDNEHAESTMFSYCLSPISTHILPNRPLKTPHNASNSFKQPLNPKKAGKPPPKSKPTCNKSVPKTKTPATPKTTTDASDVTQLFKNGALQTTLRFLAATSECYVQWYAPVVLLILLKKAAHSNLSHHSKIVRLLILLHLQGLANMWPLI